MAEAHDLPLNAYHRADLEIINGDPAAYKAIYSHRDDVTLANPFGPPVKGWADVSATLDAAASHYRDGELVGYDVVSTVVGSDLASHVEVGHFRARVGGAAEMTPFTLRVTSVFRREDDTWKVIHRHADPITSTRAAESVVER